MRRGGPFAAVEVGGTGGSGGLWGAPAMERVHQNCTFTNYYLIIFCVIL